MNCAAFRRASVLLVAFSLQSASAVPFARRVPVALRSASLSWVVRAGPLCPCAAVAFDPAGKVLASGGYKEVLLWDVSKGTLSRRVGAGTISGLIQCLLFLKDGSMLAVGDGIPGKSGIVRLFDVASGQQKACFEEPKDLIYKIVRSSKGHLLACASADGSCYVYDLSKEKLLKQIRGHSDWVTAVDFSPDDSLLLTASADRTVRLWKRDGFGQRSSVTCQEAVTAAAFGPRGQFIAVAVAGPSFQRLQIRRSDRGRQTASFFPGGRPNALLWDWKSDRLFVGSSDGTVRSYDPRRRRQLGVFSRHGDGVQALTLRKDGKVLASGAADGTVKLWNVGAASAVATFLQLEPGSDSYACISYDGYAVSSRPARLILRAQGRGPTPELKRKFLNRQKVLAALKEAGKAPSSPPRKAGRRKLPRRPPGRRR